MRALLTTDTIGGVWTFTRELTQQLLKLGHAVALVSFGRAPTQSQTSWCDHMAAEHSERFLFQASEAPLEWMQENAATLADGLDCLLEIIHNFQPDILHSSQFCWGALDASLPTLITAHSDVMSWAAACKPEMLYHRSDWLARYCSLVQRGIDGADTIVAPTQWMRYALNTHFHVGGQFDVISNGRTAPGALSGERILQAVSVGRLWDEAKGLRTLLDVDALMPMLIAGEDHFDGSIASTDKLQVLGVLNETELFHLLSQSSVYIATSIYEPFGLAPLEAALCGCAIVLRNIPSLREVWGDAALYFNTSTELREQLRILIDGPSALAEAQTAAYARARRYTADNMSSQYVALYESLTIASQDDRCVKESPAYAA